MNDKKILLRIKSHRARDKFKRLGLEYRELFTFQDGHFYEILESQLEECLKIKGIGKARKPKSELMECWK